MRLTVGLLVFVLALGGCGKKKEKAVEITVQFTPVQLQVLFSWDLGADSIDVGAYPEAQRANYETLKAECSVCHTLARPINAPYAERRDWERFVKRMHGKPGGERLDKASAKRIVDFLVFDAGERKVKRKEEFEKESARLETLFSAVKAEREKSVQEKSEKAPAKPFHYTGDK